VLAAVSGGADSAALLRALVAVKQGAGGAGQVLAGHVNHKLRGAESDADQEWLGALCGQLGVPLIVRECNTRALAEEQGDGLEAAARHARYRLLTEMAEGAAARFVVTAHTRDDQVETVLFRLLRGAGLGGLAGMRRTRPLSPSVALVRPLLNCSRQELRKYLDSISQRWREDRSNADLRFSRNRIRIELLPYLREHFNTEADAAILRIAELTAGAQQVLESHADELLEQSRAAAATAGGSPSGTVALGVGPLADQPELVVCEALRRAWRLAGWPEQAMTRRWWRELAALAQSTDPQPALNLPGNVLARRQGELLTLSPTGDQPAEKWDRHARGDD
jgi:tRNA(Ile)-lysidine synthase